MNKTILKDMKFISSSPVLHFHGWDKLRDKVVFITGAGGFLGSYLIHTLLYINRTKKLGMNIIANVRDYEKAFAKFGKQKGLDYFVADITEPFTSNVAIDIVIHAASIASPKYFEQLPVNTILPNVVGTKNLLEMIRGKEFDTFMYISSSGVLGFHPEENYPLGENDWGILDPLDKANCYLEAKRMGEALCMAYRNQFNVPVIIARPGGFYGPGLRFDDGRVFADFVSNVVEGEDLSIYSDGQAIREYMYIADMIVALFTILFHGAEGEVYNVTSDNEISILDLAKLLAYDVFKERGLQVVMKDVEEKNYPRVKFRKTTMNNSKLKGLGWAEKFTLREGFKRTVESYEN